jgi:hypothetical protein
MINITLNGKIIKTDILQKNAVMNFEISKKVPRVPIEESNVVVKLK